LPTVNFLAILSKGLGFDLENLDDEIKVLILVMKNILINKIIKMPEYIA
jgi:hypothetical protein